MWITCYNSVKENPLFKMNEGVEKFNKFLKTDKGIYLNLLYNVELYQKTY